MLGFLKQNGLRGAALYLIEQKLGLRVPLSSRARWDSSIRTEVNFWDDYFRTKGAKWGEDYEQRLDPNRQVTDDVARLLSASPTLNVLDVGAGPLTILGKYCGDRKLNLRAVDPLAAEYDQIMQRYGVTPIIRTEKLAAECLSEELPNDFYDLVFAQNCIDHSVDPVASIREMLKVTRPGGYVYLNHSQNEAEKEGWYGLHQWNLAEEQGDFIIRSKANRTNYSKEFAHLGEMECTVDPTDDLVRLTIKKPLA